MKKIILLGILLAGLVFSGLSYADDHNATDYFPLEFGSMWYYNYDYSSTNVIAPYAYMAGTIPTFVMQYNYNPQTMTSDFIELFTVDSTDGISMHGVSDPVGNVLVFDQELQLLPAIFDETTPPNFSETTCQIDDPTDPTLHIETTTTVNYVDGTYTNGSDVTIHDLVSITILIHRYQDEGGSIDEWEQRDLTLKKGVGIVAYEVYTGPDPENLVSQDYNNLDTYATFYSDTGNVKEYFEPWNDDIINTCYNENYTSMADLENVYRGRIYERKGYDYDTGNPVDEYVYAYVDGTEQSLIEYQPLAAMGTSGLAYVYTTTNSRRVELGNGMVVELQNDSISKITYNDTTSGTAWFLWGAVDPYSAYTVIQNKDDGSWWIYTFDPSKNTEEIASGIGWTYVSDSFDPPTDQSILPELGDWRTWARNNNIQVEAPPLSTDYFDNNADGLIDTQINYNPYMNTTYQFGVNTANYFDLGQWGLFQYDTTTQQLSALVYADANSVTVADLTGDGKLDDLVVDFAGAGLNWYDGSMWTNITYSNTESVSIADINNDNHNEVICDLGQWGLFQYDGSTLSALAYADANSVTVADLTGDGKLDDLVVDFAGAGLNWYDGSMWTNITYSNTESVSIADINNDNHNEVICDLGQWGLFQYDGSTLSALAYADANSVTVADLTGDGKLDDLVVDFAGAGLNWYDGSMWTNITYSNTESVSIADINNDNHNEVICDLGQWGLFQYDGSTLSALVYADAKSVTVADLTGDGKMDDLVVDFTGAGLNYYTNGTWTNITYSDADSIAVGDITGDGTRSIICDLGQWGVFEYNMNTQQFSPLTYADPDSIVLTDINGDGVKDVVANFGAGGLVSYSKDIDGQGSWTTITYAQTESLVSSLYTRLSTKAFSVPDLNGNIFYHYINEDFEGRGSGRADVCIRQSPDSNGNMAFKLSFAAPIDSPTKIKAYSDTDMTALTTIYTRYADTQRDESMTFMDPIGPEGSPVMASYVRYNDDTNREQEAVLASSDMDGFVYYHLMNEDFNSTGKGRLTFASCGDNAKIWDLGEGNTRTYESLMYTYFDGSPQIHYMYVYQDKYWGDYLGRIEYDTGGGFVLNDLADPYPVPAETAPIPGLGDQSEFDQRAAIQAKVQAYGTTQEGGFTFTNAMAGETPGVNPFDVIPK